MYVRGALVVHLIRLASPIVIPFLNLNHLLFVHPRDLNRIVEDDLRFGWLTGDLRVAVDSDRRIWGKRYSNFLSEFHRDTIDDRPFAGNGLTSEPDPNRKFPWLTAGNVENLCSRSSVVALG